MELMRSPHTFESCYGARNYRLGCLRNCSLLEEAGNGAYSYSQICPTNLTLYYDSTP